MPDEAQAIDESEYDELFDIEKGAERSGSGVIDDPYPIWADLRSRSAVHRGSLAECMGLPSERGGLNYDPAAVYYSVFSFAAVSDVFTRRNDFSSESYVDMGLPQRLGDSILNMDGLRHRRYRDLIQTYFQPATAEGWWRETIIAPLVSELVAKFADKQSVDLNSQFFARLPMHTVTAGFGMSPADGLDFRRHMLRSFSAEATAAQVAESMSATGQLLARVIRERRQEPRDDLISRLGQAELIEEDNSARKLTVEEIASFCRLIMFAGGETTWRQLGIAMFSLLNHPEQMEEIRNDRSLLQNAILESTRCNPDPLFMRKVTHDTVLHGVPLPKGAILHLCIGAANRDPAKWVNPDAYDIHRPVQRSLAFAAGAHSCLGQHVARQEIGTAIDAFLDHFPRMRWDPAKPAAKLTGSLVARGPGPMHVRLH